MKKTHLLLPISSLIFMNNVYAATVGLTWYDGTSTISGASSCTVGGTFTPPTPPARTGYVFAGWHVKEIHAPETCGINNLNTSTNGTASDASVGSGQWAREFDYGTVWGMAKCSSTSGNNSSQTWPVSSKSNWLKTPSDTSGQYCWCQATGFTPTSSNYSGGPQCTVSPASSSWVFCEDTGASFFCGLFCANSCGGAVQNKAGFRSALFGSVGQ